MKKYRGKKFTILGINSDDSLETLQKAMKKEKLRFPSFFDGGGTGGPIATQWGVTGWPTIFILDKKGVIRAAGGRARSQMDQIVAKLMNERR